LRIQSLSEADVYEALITNADGLQDEEAARRIDEFGPNEIRGVRRKPLLFRFLSHFTHFLAVLLWIAAGLSFLSEYMHPGEGMLTLGFAIIAVILINASFTFFQEYRTERALEELKKLLPFVVTVLRSGKERGVHACEVVPGDILVLSEGDKIAADARLVWCAGLKVNHAPLTGESEPVSRNAEPCDADLLESGNIVFAGTMVMSGSGRAVVFATGMMTEFGRIAHLTSAVETGLSPLQKEIVRATRIIATVALAVGLSFFSIGFFAGRSFWDNFLFAIGITVALIPEGMLPTMTLALAMGSQRMAKRKALIKTLTSVETLGAVTVICTDKTGTLTRNEMAVKQVWYGGKIVGAHEVAKEEAEELLMAASLCNNARYVERRYRGDPTDRALLSFARGVLGEVSEDRIQEIPFDAERKRMTTVHRRRTDITGPSGRVFAYAKGAPESIVPLCTKVLFEANVLALTDEMKTRITGAAHSLMDGGLRVLAFAYRDLGISYHEGSVESDTVLAGLIGLEDPPRDEVPEAIEKCRNAGIRVIMITGDASRTAVAIAREIGLVRAEPMVIEGHAFNRMGDEELKEKLTAREVIFARMTPKHKMRVVSLLKDEGEIVAVTGDGVNDAPALKKADIGISMGTTGTDVAREASDMVLLDDNFATIVSAIEEGRTVFENIKKFLTYIFASNIPEAVPYVAYILFGIPLPLTILQILAVDLGTDMIPALALGAEKPMSDVMKRPPRRVEERLLGAPLLTRSYLFLGPIEAVACMCGFFYVLRGGGWTWGETLAPHDTLYMTATTACLTGIIVTQTGNVFACRSDRASVLDTGLFRNRLIFWGIAVELALQFFIVYHPVGNKIFGTAPLGLNVWLFLIPFAVVLVLSDEARKMIVRRRAPGQS